MVRLGTCASRSPMSLTLSLSIVSAVNAVTATGTSCRVSSRLRAVTVTASRVVAEDRGVAVVALSCAQAAAGAARPRAIARLRLLVFRLRFIDAPPRDASRTAAGPHGAEIRQGPHPAASYLRTMGRHRAS